MKIVIQRITINAVDWTDINAPSPYPVGITLRNDTDGTKIRSDKTDGSTEDSFVAGISYVLGTSKPTQFPNYSGKPVFSVQSVTRESTLVVTFVV
jgi:hypothetical protein